MQCSHVVSLYLWALQCSLQTVTLHTIALREPLPYIILYQKYNPYKKHLFYEFIFLLVGLHSIGDDLPGNDESLDLWCALINLVDLGIPHQFLDRVFCVETITAEDLHGVCSSFVGDLGSVALRYRSEDRVPDTCVIIICQCLLLL